LYYKPLQLGADISICAATKYVAGHSDVIAGTISVKAELFGAVIRTSQQLGDTLAADVAALTLRGLRTLPVRLKHHDAAGREVARWLAMQSWVREVLHPAFEETPGHSIWKRDFLGATGLFAIVTEPIDRPRLDRLIDALRLFQLGYSWGGFESLILPMPAARRPDGGLLIRLHIGLEAPSDLIEDLRRSFTAIGL